MTIPPTDFKFGTYGAVEDIAELERLIEKARTVADFKYHPKSYAAFFVPQGPASRILERLKEKSDGKS